MIILTIPYRNSSDLLVSPDFESYDLIEYRIDYCSDLTFLNLPQLSDKYIISSRSIQEGGLARNYLESMPHLWSRLLSETSALIDGEFSFLKDNPQINIPSDRLVLSLHTSSDNQPLINDFIRTDVSALFYKLAVSVSDITQLEAIRKSIPAHRQDRFILIPLYPCSVTARLLYKLYGSIATFVYDKEAVIPHQASLKLAKRCNIVYLTPETEVYVIVGKEQIISSLSVAVYNDWFKKTASNRAMLPIVAQTAEEAMLYLNWLLTYTNLKGVAITMPFKHDLAQLITNTDGIINTWNPKTNEWANTDETALNKAFNALSITNHSKVLILGSGATAQMTEALLKQKGLDDITSLSRKQIEEHKSNPDIEIQCYDVLINCTPFGIDESDKAELLPSFKALIDLPYSQKATSLSARALKNNIPFVDGYTFWKWQAQAQACLFGIETEFINYLETIDLTKQL